MKNKISNNTQFKIFNLDISEIFIIISNLVPLSGVLFFGWTLYSIIYIYWLEIIILGFYVVFKIFISEFINAKEKDINLSIGYIFKIIFLIIIFIIVPLVAVLMILSNLSSIVYSAELKIRLIVNGTLVKPNLKDFIFPVSFLFLSHTFSFLYNFIGKKEYRNRKTITELMISMYLRFVYLWGVIAAALILAPIIFLLGFYIFKTSSLLYILAVVITSLFIIIKIVIDLIAHKKEYKAYKSLQ